MLEVIAAGKFQPFYHIKNARPCLVVYTLCLGPCLDMHQLNLTLTFDALQFWSSQIPKGVQPGQLLVLRGKGLPKHGFIVDHGDQYVRFRVNFPTEINERQRAILEEFAKEEINCANSNSAEGNWWQQIRERITGPKYMLELSLFMLILLFLNKTMG
jgi:hypothetical protein